VQLLTFLTTTTTTTTTTITKQKIVDPNVVQCIVPSKDFKYLADCYKPSSIVPAVLKVTDIAGLIKGASEGAGLGNAFLSHIAAVDGIYHLVRAFDSDEVIHVDDSVNPIRDLETIQGELCLKDKATLEAVFIREKDRVRKEKGLSKQTTDIPLGETFLMAHGKVGCCSSYYCTTIRKKLKRKIRFLIKKKHH
jgi:ribosome-binding ATPase YchF (GTP1/OBG family)